MLVETPRLIITDFSMDMARSVHENSLDEDNRRFVPDEVFETVEEAEELLEYLISSYGSAEEPQVHPVIVKDTGENAGYVQLVPLGDAQWELGYHIAKRLTGRGYATEAAKAFLPVICETMGIDTVYGICLKENAASVRVMEKLGFEAVYTGIGMYQGEERQIFKAVWKKPA